MKYKLRWAQGQRNAVMCANKLMQWLDFKDIETICWGEIALRPCK